VQNILTLINSRTTAPSPEPNADIVYFGIKAITAAADVGDTKAKAIFFVVPGIIAAMTTWKRDPLIQEAGALLLGSRICSGKEARLKIAGHGGIQVLCAVIRQFTCMVSLQHAAFVALSKLLIRDSPEETALAAKNHKISILIVDAANLIETTDLELNAQLLNSLCGTCLLFPENQKREMVDGGLRRLIDSFDPISPRSSTQTQDHAANIITLKQQSN